MNIQIEIIIVLASLLLKIVNDLGSNSEVITVTAINFVFWHIPVGAFSFVFTNSTFELFVLKCSQCFNLIVLVSYSTDIDTKTYFGAKNKGRP